MSFQALVASVADMWDSVRPLPPPRARERIQTALVRLRARELEAEGLAVEVLDNNPGKWKVTLFNFSLAGSGPAADLDTDLAKHNTTYGGTKGVTLEITFPDEFPSAPPNVFLRHPILRDGTGGVVAGVCVMPALCPEGWDDHYSMEKVLLWVRDSLLRAAARVDLSTNNPYPRAAYEAARRRFMFRPKEGQMEASVVFDQKLYAYSGSFALMYLDVSVSSAFQSGNKAYLPEKVLTFFQSQSGRDNPGWLTHAGMVFEVTNHLRMPAYCGVREFVCPEDDMIILPDWVHKSLFLEEGIAVRVRSVALPKLAFLRVQPHQDWKLVTDQTGLDAQTFIQAAMENYVSVALGDEMVLTAGPCSMTVNVVSTRPKAPVCALFAGFETEVGIDFLPPRDAAGADEDTTVRLPQADAGAGADEHKGDQDAANQAFVQAHAYREAARAERRRELERRGVTLPGTNADAAMVTMKVHLVAAHQVVKVMCNADRPCRDLYAYLRESYPTHKGGSHGAPFVLRLRGVALPAAILPDDDTKLSDAGVARRQVIDQEVVMSTTCIACPPPSQWECRSCTFIQPISEDCDVCGHVRSDGDRLVGSNDDEIGSFVVAKPGGTTGKFEVEVVGLCRKHTPAWLRARQASGVGIRDEDFHLITREVVLNTLQSEMI